jgi:hypothetical protein
MTERERKACQSTLQGIEDNRERDGKLKKFLSISPEINCQRERERKRER